jgi:tetratricopeptide (TPR) repeat protein
VLWNLGDIAMAEGDYAKAEQVLQESITIHRELRDQSRLYDVLISSGYAAWGLGKFFQARQYLSEALQMACKNLFLITSVRAICLAALLSTNQEKPERALELYALASRYPLVANSRWFEDVVGRHIVAAAATLTPEMVEAAQARGQARDLAATLRELLEECNRPDGLLEESLG